MTILFPESNVAPIMGPSGVVTKQLCSTLRVAPSRNNLSEKMNAQKICIYPKINGQTCFYTDLDPIIQVLELSIGSIFQQRAFIFFVHNCRYLLEKKSFEVISRLALCHFIVTYYTQYNNGKQKESIEPYHLQSKYITYSSLPTFRREQMQ
jgi:hypothetical protein